jgi:glycosyltransferase involved in cell wall biosynthesis
LPKVGLNKVTNINDETLPLVSIIIPAYNASETICRAVDSALGQDYPNVEVIVVDDASNDSTCERLETYGSRIRLIKHTENRNGAAARNSGVEFSSGELIAFLDSDDEYLSHKISSQVATMLSLGFSSNDIFCVACDKDDVIEASAKVIKIEARSIFLKEYVFNSSTLLLSKIFFEKLGGFDPGFKRHQDLEFLVRATTLGSVYLLQKKLINRHFSGSPSFQATRSGIECFWDKFQVEIESLTVQERNTVYAFGYRRMAELALREKRVIKFIYFFIKTAGVKPAFLFNKIGYYLRRELPTR